MGKDAGWERHTFVSGSGYFGSIWLYLGDLSPVNSWASGFASQEEGGNGVSLVCKKKKKCKKYGEARTFCLDVFLLLLGVHFSPWFGLSGCYHFLVRNASSSINACEWIKRLYVRFRWFTLIQLISTNSNQFGAQMNHLYGCYWWRNGHNIEEVPHLSHPEPDDHDSQCVGVYTQTYMMRTDFEASIKTTLCHVRSNAPNCLASIRDKARRLFAILLSCVFNSMSDISIWNTPQDI